MAKGTCSVEGCERPSRARGWCQLHWRRWRKFGDPLTLRRMGRKPKCRLDLFSEWTADEAWLMGLIWADGCLAVDKAGHRRVQIVSTDSELTDHASRITGAPSQRRESAPPRKPYWQVWIGAGEVVDRLEALGLTPRKTFTCTMPPVPEEMLPHFIRGYFDGDGSVGLYVSPGSGNPEPLLRSSVVGSADMMKEMAAALDAAGVRTQKPGTHGSIYRLQLSHWQSLHFAEFMYSVGGPCLTRKRDIFAEGAERFVERRSTQFVSTWLL